MNAILLRTARFCAAFALATAVFTGINSPLALAQDTLTAKETHRDWAVFIDGDGGAKVCYAATPPVKTDAVRDGQRRDSISRGDPFLMIATYRQDQVTNEVSIRFGFPGDAAKPITLKIGSDTFKMFTQDGVAWLESPDQDGAVIAAMKRGAKAVFTVTSTRGTQVTDEFSLLGFSASLDAVAEACK